MDFIRCSRISPARRPLAGLLIFSLAGCVHAAPHASGRAVSPATEPSLSAAANAPAATRAAIAAATAPAPLPGTVVTVYPGGNLLFARAKINGEELPGYFLIDTGGQMPILDAKAAQKLHLQSLGQAMVSGTSGSAVAHFCNVRSISIGDYSTGPLRIAASDLAPLGSVFGVQLTGILGGTFWGAAPFTLDYAHSTITFHDPAAFTPPAGAVEVPLVLENGHPLAEVKVENAAARFILDTGDSAPLDLDQNFSRVFPDVLRNKVLHPNLRFGFAGSARVVERAQVDRLTLFGDTLQDVPVNFSAPLPGPPGPPSGVVGGPILRQFRLTFDYARSALYAAPTPVAPLKAPLNFPVNAQDVMGTTALMRAAGDQRLDDVQTLLDAGAAIAATDHLGRTALFYAARGPSVDIVKRLLAHHADPTVRTLTGETMLIQAAESRNDAIARLLIAAREDVNAADGQGDTPLMYAALAGDVPLTQILLGAGADPRLENKKRDTALTAAAIGGHPDIAQALLAKGAPIDHQNLLGATALMDAASRNHLAVVELLLEHKANVTLKTRGGLTALDAAKLSHNPALIARVQKAIDE